MKKFMKFAVFAILLPALMLSTALLAYLHFFASNDKNPAGEWTASLDMTEQAAVTALGWLQDVEAASVSMQDMEAHMQGLTIRVNLDFVQTAKEEGTFSCSVLPESYETCRQAAYEGFAAAFREVVAQRLRMAGYAGGMDEEAIEALVANTFGMSTVEYLMFCVPDLLPALEKLQAQYDGGGSYQAAEGTLTRQFVDGSGRLTDTRVERYIRKDATLVLTEESGTDFRGYFSDHYPVIYTLRQSADQ